MASADDPIDVLFVSVRTMLLLERLGVATIGELTTLADDTILEEGSRAQLAEIRAALAAEGLAPRPARAAPPTAHPPVLVSQDADVRIERIERVLAVTLLGEPETHASPSVCQRVVDAIVGQALPSVRLACDFTSPGPAWTDARLDDVRAFVFDTPFQQRHDQAQNAIDVGRTLAAMPRLERACFVGRLAANGLAHDTLSELHLAGGEAAFAGILAKARFPRLGRLVVAPPPPSASAFAHALSTVDAPLTEIHLEVLDVAAMDEGLDLLAKRSGLAHVSVSFASAPDEEELLEALRPRPFATGLALDASRSRRFSRAAKAKVANLVDTSGWAWTTLAPAAYADW